MAKCSKCHKPIVWVKTASGKSTPQDPDGETHWATCPFADEFRKPRDSG
jgi:hypothetical protein